MTDYRKEASTGFANAASYDAHRPSFPPDSVSVLLKGLGVAGKPAADVIDLAAGTGKFTDLLLKRPEHFHVTAVEPHDGMRAILEGKGWKDLAIVNGLSTKMPLQDASVDAVVAAQSFHWFSNTQSLEEIHRVLRPGGTFGMIWNVEDYNAPPSFPPTTRWEGKLKSLIWSCDDNQPRFRHEKWRHVFDLASNRFFRTPVEEHTEHWTVWLTPEAVWERFNTLSQIAVMEGEEKMNAQRLVEAALKESDVERNAHGQVALHGVTVSAWVSRVD